MREEWADDIVVGVGTGTVAVASLRYLDQVGILDQQHAFPTWAVHIGRPHGPSTWTVPHGPHSQHPQHQSLAICLAAGPECKATQHKHRQAVRLIAKPGG